MNNNHLAARGLKMINPPLKMEVIKEVKAIVCKLYFRGQILYYWC